MRVPVEAKSFLRVALEADLRVNLAIRLKAMLGTVEYQDFAIDGQRSDKIGVFGAVASLIDLAGMVDPLNNVPLHGCRLTSRRRFAKPADLATLIIVVVCVRTDGFGYLNLGDLDMVGLSVGRMRSEQDTVNLTVLPVRLLDVREPLHRKRGPG